ncbi:hypothetical protein FLT15_02515 [Paenibacillus thiaminolyticus]|uniref:hypothetical protein n=1 Tax=Paenibacillus thiaminolyticus TaxID=49283 RepID=UPI00116379ED|nr:hypothetical protein [Paenibacillus thiaminolyticus]NGP57290.1 hypothetical protein [Paenibacillus thiaminolyticus]
MKPVVGIDVATGKSVTEYDDKKSEGKPHKAARDSLARTCANKLLPHVYAMLKKGNPSLLDKYKP